MTAREYLEQARQAKYHMDALRVEYAMRLEAVTALRSPDLSDRVQRSPEQDAAYVARLVALDEDIKRLEQATLEWTDKCREVSAKINALEDERARDVLIQRYVGGNTWGDIADAMGYGVRQIYRMHEWALELFEDKHEGRI